MTALAETLHGMEQGERGTYRFASYADQFHIPLGFALLLVIAATVLSERGLATRLGVAVVPVASSVFLSACGGGDAHRAELALREGNAHYRAGRFLEAGEAYARAPLDHRAVFNHGNAAYRAGDRTTAVDRYTTHLAMVPDSLKAATYFNLGDARAMQARAADSIGRARLQEAANVKIEGDVAQRVSQYVLRDSLQREARRLYLLTDSALNESAQAFKACLRTNPADEEARYNLAQVMRLIAARPGQGRDGRDGGKDEKALGEVARLLLAKADTLVDQHRFREALDLLQRGLKQDPTLQQRKEYMDKLETVTKAAEAA
jgi:tetratricopeptide (TPR) repeat protein